MTRTDDERPLTPGEIALATPLFGAAIRWGEVRIRHRRWWPFQPHNVIMAPDGHIWIPPGCLAWHDDFARASAPYQRLFVHELTHVWQAQTRGRWWLMLMRHPFCRYRYALQPGWPLARYGIEQQAEIVADAFVARRGSAAAPLAGWTPAWLDRPILRSGAEGRGSDPGASGHG